MTQTDWIGFVGVSVLLVAYFLNLRDIITKNSLTYLILNFIGASLACFASILLKYLPFIILEGAWTLVSALGIFAYFIQMIKKKKSQKQGTLLF